MSIKNHCCCKVRFILHVISMHLMRSHILNDLGHHGIFSVFKFDLKVCTSLKIPLIWNDTFGSVTNFGLGKLVANNFRIAKAYSNSEFAALIEAAMKKLLLKPHKNFAIFQSVSSQPKIQSKVFDGSSCKNNQ